MHNIFQYQKIKNDVVYDQNKLEFGRAIIGVGKEIFFDSFTVLI